MKFAIHWKPYYFVNVHAKTFRDSSRMRERMEFLVRFSFITMGFRLIRTMRSETVHKFFNEYRKIRFSRLC